MNQLTKFLVDGILNEGEQKTLAAYGGGFKPPTSGHFEVVKQALKDNPEIDEFIIYVGSGTRNGITQAESILIWEIYQTYLPMKVKIEPSKAPIGDVLRLGKNNPQDKVYFVIGAREGNEGDLEDIKNRTRAIGGKHPNMEVKIITTKNEGMSGTNARKAAKVSFEDFAKFLPTELSNDEKETVYNIVKPVVKESLNENASYSQDIDIKQRIMQLTQHMLDKGMNIEPLPSVELLDGDSVNAREFLGKTAYYDPNSATIVLYTEGRHPKDIVRSFSHEMIHHIQNLEGRLGNIITTNTQEDDDLNDIEAEANLKGTMTFRNWTDSLNEGKKPYKHKYGFDDKLGKDPFGISAYARELALGLEEEIDEGRKKKKDPKKGTGKKPKDSSRRLYTDEDPKDTIGIKFRTKEDIVDTLNKKSFKAKSHARQSQIINLIHQRVRAAYNNAKDPDTKSRLKRGLDYITKKKEASKEKTKRLRNITENTQNQDVKFKRPKLNYSYTSLQPYIDKETMEEHFDKHFKGYTDKLNAELDEKNIRVKAEDQIQAIQKILGKYPKNNTIKNNGGGFYNHVLYFENMTPDYKAPSAKFRKMLEENFNSFSEFKDKFKEAGLKQFGSGWVFLIKKGNKLVIESYANQDNPYLDKNFKGEILIAMDVWEHAYYLKHKSQRGKYIGDFFRVIDYKVAEERLKEEEILGENIGSKTQKMYGGEPLPEIIKEDILDRTDLVLPRGKKIILQAEEENYDRGLIVELSEEGGYKMNYWYGDDIQIYPVEVEVDGELIKPDAIEVYMKFHPELKKENVAPDHDGKAAPYGSGYKPVNENKTTHKVIAKGIVFEPKDIIINVGDTVEWENKEGYHNVNGKTSHPRNKNNPESFGNKVGSGWTYKFTFTKPGLYKYHCDPHLSADMVGTIQVKENVKEGDTYEKMAAKGKKAGSLKQGTVRKRLGIKKGDKIPLSLINKEIARLRKMGKDPDKKGAQLGDKNKKYYKALQLAKTLKTTTNVNEDAGMIKCSNCGWEWELSNGGDDPYLCHKCGHDNKPNLMEGRYDTITNKLSKIIFKAFKDIHDRGEDKGEISLTIGPNDEDIISNEFEFDLEATVEFVDDDQYGVDGGANVGFDDEGEEVTPLLSVRFKIPKNPKWNTISFDIKDVVRHELEHLTQEGENLKSGKFMKDDQILRNLIDMELLSKAEYFKLEKEVDAMLQGMYFKAKKSKTPFEKVLNDYLDIFVDQKSISKEEKDDVLNIWRSRRKSLSLPPFE